MAKDEDSGHSPAVAVICRTFVDSAPIDGAAFTEMLSDQTREIWCASDPVVDELERIQYSLGEGPTQDAFLARRPVLVADLADSGATARWPVFSEEIAHLPVGGLFAIPMQVGAITAGVCLSYRWATRPLSADDLGALLRAVDAATLALLSLRAGANDHDDAGDLEGSRSRDVHQATGMLVVQLGVGVEDAFARLRAHAYTTGQTVYAVATDIVQRRLRLDPDPPGPGGPVREE
ncbi:GAF and ANTAR domain-containing protein [Nocardioides humilatus]|uniref:GAF and ANTAR domain-containing protein n=1 Tax=Nocardioides humilatus TaxID=2607660 RepID=A0A5B1L9M7_9ACTN|nr:GAF and ANTAR domain-containing protein [Nocardioides humilatus]KAA1416918.1 GAF and ANTAR domain-containing protein [Nocardioides humilatus]